MPRASAFVLAALFGLSFTTAAFAESPPSRIVSGWIPYWMSSQSNPQGVITATTNSDLFVDVSPFWYSVTKSGSDVKVGFNANYGNSSGNSSWALAQLRAAGIPVLPSIADASGTKTMAGILADPAKRSAHVGDIVNIVISNNYDGIDLDYEKFAFSDGSSSWDSTQPNWTAFVAELGTALHAQGKQLAVTIPPPCSMSGNCSTRTGYYVYNMIGIAPFVDRIRIMAYDYSYSVAGPIAPYNWVRAMVQYSALVIDPAKVQIGVPTYGRYWTEKAGGAYKLTGTCPSSSSSGGEKATYNSLISRGSMTDADIPAFIAKQGGAAQWDEASKESYFRYNKTVNWTDSNGASQSCTANKIMWFVGPEGVLARTQLVGEFGINAAAYWTVGGDNPDQWPLIRGYAQSLAPVVPEVSVAAPPAVVFGQPSALTTSAVYNGAPIVNATAVLQRSDAGTWVDVASGVTGADGAVGIPFAIEASATLRIVVRATQTTPEVISAEFSIMVTSTVSARAKTKSVNRGATMKVPTVVRPAVAAQKVVLQVQQGATWQKVTATKTKANGRIVIKTKANLPKGKYTFRVLAQPKSGIGAGVSGTFTIRIK